MRKQGFIQEATYSRAYNAFEVGVVSPDFCTYFVDTIPLFFISIRVWNRDIKTRLQHFVLCE